MSGQDDGGWTMVVEGSGDTGLTLDFEGQVTGNHIGSQVERHRKKRVKEGSKVFSLSTWENGGVL